MLILRLRQAEVALAAGRLDEALRLVGDHGLGEHRRGQRLIGRLVERLVERGRRHLEASRLAEALVDADKANRLGGAMSCVAELRGRVARAIAAQRREADRRAFRADVARDHARRGEFSAGCAAVRAIADNDSSVTWQRIGHAMARDEAELRDRLAEAEAAIERRAWAAAAEALRTAQRRYPSHERVRALRARVAEAATDQAATELASGRPDRATTLLRAIEGLDEATPAAQECRRSVAEVREAAEALRRGEHRRLIPLLRRLRQRLPGAAWVNEALEQAEQLERAASELEAGPLGLVWEAETVVAGTREELSIPRRRPLEDSRPSPGFRAHRGALGNHRGPGASSAFLLDVEGVGAFVMHPGPSVTLGAVSGPAEVDVGIVAEPTLTPARVVRRDEDYFVEAERPIRVNGQSVRHKLLHDGDKLELSPRCRLRFTLPHAASTTAVLELSGARLPRGDVRRVVLLDRDLIVGPGPAAHVRAASVSEPIVLSWRDGRLVHRGTTVAAGSAAGVGDRVLPWDETVEVGALRVRCGRWC